jgi:hypothetical protein
MLLTIVRTARKPTPIKVAALTRTAHKPATLTPHRSRTSSPTHTQSTGARRAHQPCHPVSEGSRYCGRLLSSTRCISRWIVRMPNGAMTTMAAVASAASMRMPCCADPRRNLLCHRSLPAQLLPESLPGERRRWSDIKPPIAGYLREDADPFVHAFVAESEPRRGCARARRSRFDHIFALPRR